MDENGVISERGEGVAPAQLMALLRGLMRSEGRMEAAEILGVSYRTLARAVESGKPSPRLADALELLMAKGGPAAARRQDRIRALEQRVERLEGQLKELRGGLDAVRAAVESRGAAQAETGHETQGTAEGPSAGEKARARRKIYRELDPLVVTVEPAEDDAEVYGAAWPLIEEWRRLWKEHPNKGKTLSWLVREERILALEVAMLEEHGLTLPPETYPLKGFWRRSQLNWRQEALYDTRRARAKRELLRWVRRVLTLGRWWK